MAQYLGKISYCIYLSHKLIRIAVDAALLKVAPVQGQTMHYWLLIGITLALTILASGLLYKYVEAPGIDLGRKIAERWKDRPTLEKSVWDGYFQATKNAKSTNPEFPHRAPEPQSHEAAGAPPIRTYWALPYLP